MTKFKIFEWQPCGHKWEIDTDEESANEYMNKCLICEVEALLAEIKANNKTYRMAQDRANDDIEALTADIDEYQQQQDEIIVALGSKGILPSEIVSKVRSLLAENRALREGLEDFFSQIEDCRSTHTVCGQFTSLATAIKENLASVATLQNKAPVLSETETQMDGSQEQINEDKTPLRADQVEADGETDAADTRQDCQHCSMTRNDGSMCCRLCGDDLA